jgi:phage I-like protein
MSTASTPTQRRSAPPAAPVSRSGNGSGGKPNTYRMTPEEREIAQMMGMSPEDYARNKIALRKEGKLSH